MSYKIHVKADDRAYPLIVCDHCGKPIERAADGNALWLETEPGANAGRTFDVHHAHDRCTAAFERTHPTGDADRWMFNELDHHFFMLLRNCRYDAKQGRRSAELLANLD